MWWVLLFLGLDFSECFWGLWVFGLDNRVSTDRLCGLFQGLKGAGLISRPSDAGFRLLEAWGFGSNVQKYRIGLRGPICPSPGF